MTNKVINIAKARDSAKKALRKRVMTHDPKTDHNHEICANLFDEQIELLRQSTAAMFFDRLNRVGFKVDAKTTMAQMELIPAHRRQEALNQATYHAARQVIAAVCFHADERFVPSALRKLLQDGLNVFTANRRKGVL